MGSEQPFKKGFVYIRLDALTSKYPFEQEFNVPNQQVRILDYTYPSMHANWQQLQLKFKRFQSLEHVFLIPYKVHVNHGSQFCNQDSHFLTVYEYNHKAVTASERLAYKSSIKELALYLNNCCISVDWRAIHMGKSSNSQLRYFLRFQQFKLVRKSISEACICNEIDDFLKEQVRYRAPQSEPIIKIGMLPVTKQENLVTQDQKKPFTRISAGMSQQTLLTNRIEPAQILSATISHKLRMSQQISTHPQHSFPTKPHIVTFQQFKPLHSQLHPLPKQTLPKMSLKRISSYDSFQKTAPGQTLTMSLSRSHSPSIPPKSTTLPIIEQHHNEGQFQDLRMSKSDMGLKKAKKQKKAFFQIEGHLEKKLALAIAKTKLVIRQARKQKSVSSQLFE